MASLQKSFSGDDMMTEPNQDMIDNMQAVMAQKAEELFRLCDTEEKGYITKSDMQRLRSELPVSTDQLEVVFDSLDNDGNGYLSLEEFTDGFGRHYAEYSSGSFLGLRAQGESQGEVDEHHDEEDLTVYEGEAGVADPAMEEKMFKEMIRQMGANGIFQDEDIIKAMWQKLLKEDPDMVSALEEFLGRLAGDIKKSKVDFQSLEAALHSKNNEHEEEVKKLYEEMELQIKQEREKILAEERTKEKQLKGDLEAQLKEKERQLQEILSRHHEMEQKMEDLNKVETVTKQENERLQKEKDQLEELLSQSQENLEESRTYIQQMQNQQKDEKRERARSCDDILVRSRKGHHVVSFSHNLDIEKPRLTRGRRAALMLSEGIAIERESLVKQLDILKDVNKKLRDDKDEAEATDIRRVKQIEDNAAKQPKPEPRKALSKQGSVLSNYFPGGGSTQRGSTELVSVDLDPEELHDYDGDVDVNLDDESLHEATVFLAHEHEDTLGALSTAESRAHQRSLRRHHRLSSGDESGGGDDSVEGGSKGKKVRGKLLMPKTARSQPIGADAQNVSENAVPKPQRIFKIVFVGDSGVGKSTFIYHVCHQEFKPNFSATIGVDFQVKTMDTKNATVILQLWDTAGQERFRSMTKAYFRKADGVIIMYDVTGENSFKSVRNWMSSVQEQVEPGTVLMLLGNKYDMSEDDAKRPVKEKDGQHLAVEFEMLFYETSAKTGYNIQEAMEELTSLLEEKEDKKIEECLKLSETKPKKKCCSR